MSYQKSTYGKSSYGAKKTGGNMKQGEERKSKTTHYAYVLKRDAEGNVEGKDFVNELQIYENEGKFGTYLKMRVTGPVPTADIFIAKKKGA